MKPAFTVKIEQGNRTRILPADETETEHQDRKAVKLTIFKDDFEEEIDHGTAYIMNETGKTVEIVRLPTKH